MPDIHESTYNAWLGRKQTTLRRPTLDCGCVNGGVVSFHLWCDRLACPEHAESPHDCGEFKGSKSGIEEEAVEPEAVAAFGLVDGNLPEGAEFDPVTGSVTWAMNSSGSAPICRGCRTRSLAGYEPAERLCDTCRLAPPCGNTRTNALDGRHMLCIRPSSHLPPCEEQAGSQWYAESPVAPLRPFLGAALDSEAAAFTAGVFAALDELVEPEPVVVAPDRYMMATQALHTLGDISRDEPGLAIIYGETETDFIGEWATGFGFVNVHFPKESTRPLTEEERQHYGAMSLNGQPLAERLGLPGGTR